MTFVRTDPDAPPRQGISTLLIPCNAEGVTVKTLPKLAGQGTHTCEVFFDDVRVPEANLVGELHRGLDIMYELPSREDITKVEITREMVLGEVPCALPPLQDQSERRESA